MTKLIGVLVFVTVMVGAKGNLRAEDSKEAIDPHQIPKEQFAQQVEAIAVRRPFLPSDIENEGAVAARIESTITEILQSKGYRVVNAAEYERVWQLLSQRAGGAFDPITGKPDDKKFEVVHTHTARELERLHGADAVLTAWIVFRPVRPGTETGLITLWGDRVTFRGQPLKHHPQMLMASYIALRIYDINGAELYNGEAGLEWTKVFFARSYDVKPTEQRYSDGYLRHTVRLLLDPMVARPSAGSDQPKDQPAATPSSN